MCVCVDRESKNENKRDKNRRHSLRHEMGKNWYFFKVVAIICNGGTQFGEWSPLCINIMKLVEVMRGVWWKEEGV